jgi:DNA-directed RNA polymerase specialized sigma24 family protein
MPASHWNTLVKHLRSSAKASPAAELPDTVLLDRFVRGGDPAAFEVLVWRHGPLVWKVCKRIVQHEQDAEDAFQATFLVLARKAPSIVTRPAIAGWLYKVAYRVALEAGRHRSAALRGSRPLCIRSRFSRKAMAEISISGRCSTKK